MFVRLRGDTVRVQKKLAVLLFAGFGLKKLPQLNIRTVHNLKMKSLGITLTPWAMFMPICTFLLFLVSEALYGEEAVHSCNFGLF